jgi:hypothetical protein
MFAKWIIDQEKPATYDPTQNVASEPWTSNAACAWVLGMKLQAAEFQRFVLSKFIQTCALAIEGPWAYIESHTPVGSPLRRFSDHWVAWNCSLAGRGNNEYSALEGSKRAHLVTKDTRDPRTFDIQHWYMSCSTQLDPSCEHDSLTRLINDEKARNKAASSVKLPETGRFLENRRQAARLPQRAAPARYVPLNATPTAPPAQYGYRANNKRFSSRSEATFCGVLWQTILCVLLSCSILAALIKLTSYAADLYNPYCIDALADYVHHLLRLRNRHANSGPVLYTCDSSYWCIEYFLRALNAFVPSLRNPQWYSASLFHFASRICEFVPNPRRNSLTKIIVIHRSAQINHFRFSWHTIWMVLSSHGSQIVQVGHK